MKFKKSIVLLLLVCIYLGQFIFSADTVRAADNSNKKILIMIMNYVDVNDILNAQTPNIDDFISRSGTGLMNIRGKNTDPSSSYMSLACGMRVGTIADGEFAYNSSETVEHLPGIFDTAAHPPQASDLYALFTGIQAPAQGVVNLYAQPMEKYAENYNPAYDIGQLGNIAAREGLKIAVLGNADTRTSVNRDAVLLAMDRNGAVPLGDVSQALAESDPRSPGGFRTNNAALLSAFEKFITTADIVILDTGDTSRLEADSANYADNLLPAYRKKAIENADSLLGLLLKKVDLDKTMIMILTPNPSGQTLKQGNFGLTAAILYNPDGGQGLLTSPISRRSGLVTNMDVLPTVLSFLRPEKYQAANGMTLVKTDNNSLSRLSQQLAFFLDLRQARSPLHYTFILLALISILGGFWFYILKSKFSYLNPLIYATFSMPLILLFLSYYGYSSISTTITIALAAALMLGLLIHVFVKDPYKALLLLTGLTALLLIIDGFRGSALMLLSALGSDAIAGGRFYGIGNDYLGIILANTLIFTSLIVGRMRLNPVGKALTGIIPLIIAGIVIGHPHLGANVGGLLATIVAIGTFFLITSQKKFTIKQFLLAVLLAVVGVVSVASLDAFLNPTPSHAGKAILELISGGVPVFFNIIKTKLGILGGTLISSAWTLVLLLGLLVLGASWYKARTGFLRIAVEQPAFHKSINILLVTAAAVFFFKDTGPIATAIIITYMCCCLWIAMYYTEGISGGSHN